VTGIAGVGAVNMISRFAGSNRTIVTTGARANHFVVIHRTIGDRCPGGRKYIVASITLVGTVNVICTLATGRYTVVTRNTVVHKG
jgi:hypothetical protein